MAVNESRYFLYLGKYCCNSIHFTCILMGTHLPSIRITEWKDKSIGKPLEICGKVEGHLCSTSPCRLSAWLCSRRFIDSRSRKRVVRGRLKKIVDACREEASRLLRDRTRAVDRKGSWFMGVGCGRRGGAECKAHEAWKEYRLPFKSIRRGILWMETGAASTRALGPLAFTPKRASSGSEESVEGGWHF